MGGGGSCIPPCLHAHGSAVLQSTEHLSALLVPGSMPVYAEHAVKDMSGGLGLIKAHPGELFLQ